MFIALVWHITERTFELWMAARGCNIVYSSIPYFKKDLEKHRPQWMVLVPRVLEKIAKGVQDKFASGSIAVRLLSKFFTQIGNRYRKYEKDVRGLIITPTINGWDEIVARVMLTLLTPFQVLGNKLVWSKVRQGFGGRVKVIISGGSALAGALETFYETAGIPVCVGYGLTECSPLITFRRLDRNLVTAGCAGTACAATEFRIVDPAAPVNAVAPRASLPVGEAGLILAKGPQVMKGYYKNPDATAKAIDTFGWFDTGDLGRVNPATGDLILTGRAKDTIVLSNGENIEPVPLEDAILGAAPFIDQVMLTGQDGRSLVAIAVVNPIELANLGLIDGTKAETWHAAMEKVNDPKCSMEEYQANHPILVAASAELRSNAQVVRLVEDVVKGATSSSAGFRKWEKVNDVYLTVEPFAMVNGQLTQSYKVKRPQVMERYGKELSL
jgi:long-chain acyl-CoA synthetase